MSADPITRQILALFPGAEIVADGPRPADAPALIGGMHQINAPIFGALAPDMVRHGWSVFPQNRGDRRGPGKVDGLPLSWKPFQTRIPTQKEIAWWASFCPSHNVAGILGPASGHTFALDIDVADEDLSPAIVDLADSMLGYTPFRRVGRFPRIVLIFREAGAASARSDDLIRSKPYKFSGPEGHALEILARGAPVTMHGMHHKTGRYFKWLDAAPHSAPPDLAPEVSRDQLDAFLLAVNDLRPFAAAASRLAMAETWTFDAEAGLHVPAELGVTGEWTEEDGKVTDGRERFLFHLVRATVRANEGAARNDGPGRQNLCALVEAEFTARAATTGRWTGEALRREISAKVGAQVARCIELNAFERVRRGSPVSIDAEGRVEHAPAPVESRPAIEPPPIPGLAHIKQRMIRKGVIAGPKPKHKLLSRPDPELARQRALIMDEEVRIAAARDAVRQVEEHEHRFIVDRLYARAAERHRKETAAKKAGGKVQLDAGIIQILKGDAGVGKTRSFWKAMARAKRELGPIGYPVGFAAPSHANIEDNLGAAVADRLAWERDVKRVEAEAHRHGLKTVVFRGKARTNCAFKSQQTLLDEAGIGHDRLCKARVQILATVTGEKPTYEERRCPFFDQCEYQKTIAEVHKADVVLFASAYFAVPAPAALSTALIGVFVDERPYSGLLCDNSQGLMPLSLLKNGRATPRLVKAEIEALKERNGGVLRRGVIEDAQNGMVSERESAVRMVMPHLEKGDVAGALRELHEYRPGGERLGLAYAETAKIIVSRTDDAAKNVFPGMTEEAAAAVASAPTSEGLRQERKFWSIVCDRLEAMRDDEDEPLDTPRARGNRDHRLQVMLDGKDGPRLRMSWRRTPSFDGLPLLMLDASAEPRIVEKVWKDRVVEVLPVTAPCHMQTVLITGSTFSDRSMDPGRATRDDDVTAACVQLDRLKDLIVRLAGVHGNGRVLVCSNLNIQPLLRARWTKPKNVDFVWNGGLRGLDFAKNHVAAICIGRMEPPPRAIDAQVAALTYDDACPEEPVDRFGTGNEADGTEMRPLRGPRRVQMRDGSDVTISDTIYDGYWASIMQRQIRDEEVRQFAARLRPVHRVGDPPTVYIACSAVPDGMIVDDIVDLDDMLSRGTLHADRPWEIARAAEGLMDTTRGWEHREDLGGRPDGTLDPDALMTLKLDVEGSVEARGTTRLRYRIGAGETWRHASVLTHPEDPIAPLRESIEREYGIGSDAFATEVTVEILWQGAERKASGTRPPDKVDLALTDLPSGSSPEAVSQVYADQEAADREAMMAQVRSELTGLPADADPAKIEAALRRRRIEAINWYKLSMPNGASRKDGTMRLSERILAARYGVGAAEVDVDEEVA